MWLLYSFQLAKTRFRTNTHWNDSTQVHNTGVVESMLSPAALRELLPERPFLISECILDSSL